MQYKFIEHGEKLKNLAAKEAEERRKLEELEEQKGRARGKILSTQSSGDSPRKPLGYEGSSSNSSKSESDGDTSWKTSSNFFDSDDEDNPLNR